MRIGVVTLSLGLLLTACAPPPGSQTASNASPAATITPDDEKASQKIDADQLESIHEFVDEAYKGWTLSGTSGGDESACMENTPCFVHLVQGDKNQVIVVMVREFQRADGATYLLAFPAPAAANGAADEIREKARSEVLENLTEEQCAPVFYGHKAGEPPSEPNNDK